MFTHDLDFSVIIATTRASKPSVVQIRTQDPSPSVMGDALLAALGQFSKELESGAIVVVEPTLSRARVLPL